MPTRLWDVQSTLKTTFTAALPDTVKVFGATRGRSAAPKEFVLVGSDGGETGVDSFEDGLTAEQGWSDLGPGTWREETGTVVCSIWVWSGSNIDALNTRADELLGLCETAVLNDRSLGGLLVATGLAELAGISISAQETDKGPFVRVTFQISYTALLT